MLPKRTNSSARKRSCNDECLRRIAARLCLLEGHTQLNTGRHVDENAGNVGASIGEQAPPNCSENETEVWCDNAEQQETDCTGELGSGKVAGCNVDRAGATGCCTGANTSHDGDRVSDIYHSPAASTSTCCPGDRPQDACGRKSNIETGCKNSRCEDNGGGQTDVEEDGNSTRRNDMFREAVDAPGDCSTECCKFVGNTTTEASSACSSHLRAAFERFEALIRQSKCICRSVVAQMGFCCCTLSPDGSMAKESTSTGQTAMPAEAQKTKETTSVKASEKTSDAICCTDRKQNAYGTSCTALSDNGGRGIGCCTEWEQGTCSCIRKTSKNNKSCSDGCCTPYTENVSTCDDRISKRVIPETIVGKGVNVDVEHNAAREHVVLGVSGMTCTGCSTKMQNVLESIPGLYKPQVTFVSGTAAFELDGDVARIAEVLPLIERRTGFKCSRIVEGYQYLDLQMTPQMAKQLEDSYNEGLISVVKAKGKTYRINYNPLIIGARDLLPPGATLAPPAADPSTTEGNNRLLQMTWYTAVAAALTIPVVVLNWAPNPVPTQTRGITSLALATCVQAIAVPEFYSQAIKSLVFSKVVEMDMLVVISITVAYAYSVVAFILAETGIELKQEAFFETSTLLITLVLFGRLVAAIARVRAIRAVSLRSLQVDTSLLLHPDNRTTEIDSRLLHFGDTILIRAHSRIVTDGTLISGVSAVDESMLTGEAIPITKQQGDAVIAGTINGEGVLHVRITRLHGANSISDIAKSVEDALGVKPRVQDLADRVASWFVPAVVTIAAIVFAIWIGLALTIRSENGGGAVGTAITYAIAVLAVSCPCALGLAVPMVLVIAGGVAARQGVVIKAADATERAFKVTDVVFDKTGTLTRGDLRVVREEALSDRTTRDEALAMAKALVKDDSHPVSKAIAAHLSDLPSDVTSLDHAKSIPGSGIQAEWNGRIVRAGNPFWLGMEDNAIVTQLLDQGMTCFCININNIPVLAIGLESTLRDEATAVLNLLRNRNITPHIVSGDHARAVEAVARSLDIGLPNTTSRRSPVQKKEYVSKLQASGKIVLFCGDGTNDAIALAQANVGVQLGSASDVAGAVADVVLLRGLDGVLVLLDVSKRAFVRISFNFVWSAVYNVFAILLAAGAFVKFRIPPAYAGLGEIVSVGPVILAAVSMLAGNGNRS